MTSRAAVDGPVKLWTNSRTRESRSWYNDESEYSVSLQPPTDVDFSTSWQPAPVNMPLFWSIVQCLFVQYRSRFVRSSGHVKITLSLAGR